MDRFAQSTAAAKGWWITWASDAERFIVLLGSGVDTVHETVEDLTLGERWVS
jgi:hypothetical protein